MEDIKVSESMDPPHPDSNGKVDSAHSNSANVLHINNPFADEDDQPFRAENSNENQGFPPGSILDGQPSQDKNEYIETSSNGQQSLDSMPVDCPRVTQSALYIHCPQVSIDEFIPPASYSSTSSFQLEEFDLPRVEVRMEQDEPALVMPYAKVSSPTTLRMPSFGSPTRGLIDNAPPIESVKEAVSKIGGIVDWKAHRNQTVERRKLVEQEIEKIQQEMPEYRRRSEDAEQGKTQVLNELDNTKRLIEDLKLNLERAQIEEHQAKQDSELTKLRVEELEQGITDDVSIAAKQQLEVAKSQHRASISELNSVNAELEIVRKEYSTLDAEKEEAVKKAQEAVSSSKEVEKRVEELTIELIATKESLISTDDSPGGRGTENRSSHGQGARCSLYWEKELKRAEEELQALNQQIVSARDLKSKVDTASGLLLDLKAELADYMESKLKEDYEGDASSEELGSRSRSDVQAAVASAKKELEEVKRNIEKASEEVNCLKVAAMSLQSELKKERPPLLK